MTAGRNRKLVPESLSAMLQTLEIDQPAPPAQTLVPTDSGIPQRLGTFATILDALDYAAQGHTGLSFFSAKGDLTDTLSYRDLRDAARLLARRLLGSGFAAGERIAIVAETRPDFVIAFFACQIAGLIPAPLPLPATFGGRNAYVTHVGRLAAEARAVALLAPANLATWLAPLVGQGGVNQESGGIRLCCAVADLAHAPLAPAPLAEAALPTIDPDSIAYLQFSSGSTRFPLGIVVHHRALMANASSMLAHGLEICPTDRGISWLPLYHDLGLVGFLLTPLAGQMTVDLIATSDFARRPLLWLSLISANGCTVSYSPSFGFDLCMRRARTTTNFTDRNGARLDLSSWRVAGIGGDMIRAHVLEGFAATFAPWGFDARAFLPSYGMAEATLAITFAPVGRGVETDTVDLDRLEHDGIAVAPASDVPGAPPRARTVVLCGIPIPLHDIEVRGADGAALPDRRVGRILARGPSLMRGYDGRGAETDAVLSPEGWLDTGDLGYWLCGALVVTGRAKDLIIINGRNIWPQDLEWTIEQSVPEIRTGNVAAFSVEEDGQEVLILAAEARAMPERGTRESLMAAIGDTLRSEHGVEGRVVLVPMNTLPYTSSGKLSRSAARARYLAGTLAQAAV